jgi:hypothetical protein
MCCFSRPVQSVTATHIFARPAEDGRQFLVYSMTLKAKEDLAMVLPLPVKEGSGEKAVMFIDLKNYSNFFDDVESGFNLRDYLKSSRLAHAAPRRANWRLFKWATSKPPASRR